MPQEISHEGGKRLRVRGFRFGAQYLFCQTRQQWLDFAR